MGCFQPPIWTLNLPCVLPGMCLVILVCYMASQQSTKYYLRSRSQGQVRVSVVEVQSGADTDSSSEHLGNQYEKKLDSSMEMLDNFTIR